MPEKKDILKNECLKDIFSGSQKEILVTDQVSRRNEFGVLGEVLTNFAQLKQVTDIGKIPLDGEIQQRIEKHLSTCFSCRLIVNAVAFSIPAQKVQS